MVKGARRLCGVLTSLTGQGLINNSPNLEKLPTYFYGGKYAQHVAPPRGTSSRRGIDVLRTNKWTTVTQFSSLKIAVTRTSVFGPLTQHIGVGFSMEYLHLVSYPLDTLGGLHFNWIAWASLQHGSWVGCLERNVESTGPLKSLACSITSVTFF